MLVQFLQFTQKMYSILLIGKIGAGTAPSSGAT